MYARELIKILSMLPDTVELCVEDKGGEPVSEFRVFYSDPMNCVMMCDGEPCDEFDEDGEAFRWDEVE